jgi:hypothetical protein
MLKLLSTARLEVLATVETQVKFTNSLMTLVFIIHHANSMLRTIFKDAFADQLTFAVTAHGHPLQQVTLVLRTAGLLMMLFTISVTIMKSKVQIK